MAIKINNPERIQSRPSAVIFDTDNTLYEYQPAHKKALSTTREKACSLLGISQSDFDRAYMMARDEIKQRLGKTASSHSRILYFQRLIEILGLKTQILLSMDLDQTYWRTFLMSAVLFEGVQEFLEELRAKGIPTAIITDLTSQIQYRKIIYFGLDKYFDYVVTSEESGHDKPHPASFILASEKLNIHDGEIWMIGDDPKADIKGAKEHLNAVTCQKKHKGVSLEFGDSLPDVIFDS